jgi:hypothetical protein
MMRQRITEHPPHNPNRPTQAARIVPQRKGFPTPNIPRIVSAPVEYVPVLSARFARRVAVCVLITVLDVAVITTFGPTLYQVSLGHPFWLAGLAILFATMFFTLVHAWIQTLRGRFR